MGKTKRFLERLRFKMKKKKLTEAKASIEINTRLEDVPATNTKAAATPATEAATPATESATVAATPVATPAAAIPKAEKEAEELPAAKKETMKKLTAALREVPDYIIKDGKRSWKNSPSNVIDAACKGGANNVVYWGLRRLEETDRHAWREALNRAVLTCAARGDTRLLSWLVSQGGDIGVSNVTEEEDTALHLAAGRGHTETVKWLLSQGVEAWVMNKNARTPQECAGENGRTGCFLVLNKLRPGQRIVVERGKPALFLLLFFHCLFDIFFRLPRRSVVY